MLMLSRLARAKDDKNDIAPDAVELTAFYKLFNEQIYGHFLQQQAGHQARLALMESMRERSPKGSKAPSGATALSLRDIDRMYPPSAHDPKRLIAQLTAAREQWQIMENRFHQGSKDLSIEELRALSDAHSAFKAYPERIQHYLQDAEGFSASRERYLDQRDALRKQTPEVSSRRRHSMHVQAAGLAAAIAATMLFPHNGNDYAENHEKVRVREASHPLEHLLDKQYTSPSPASIPHPPTGGQNLSLPPQSVLQSARSPIDLDSRVDVRYKEIGEADPPSHQTLSTATSLAIPSQKALSPRYRPIPETLDDRMEQGAASPAAGMASHGTMVLTTMIHNVRTDAAAVNPRLNMSPYHLRTMVSDLQDQGYRGVHIDDFVNRDFAKYGEGAALVLYTLDDALQSQFNILLDDKGLPRLDSAGKPVIDPDCAVGILLEARKREPTLSAVFYISYNHGVAFGQPGLDAYKLNYLLDNGFAIGNHTYSHRYGQSADDFIQDVQHCDQMTQSLIGERAKEMRTFAYPGCKVYAQSKVRSFMERRFDLAFGRAGEHADIRTGSLMNVPRRESNDAVAQNLPSAKMTLRMYRVPTYAEPQHKPRVHEPDRLAKMQQPSLPPHNPSGFPKPLLQGGYFPNAAAERDE